MITLWRSLKSRQMSKLLLESWQWTTLTQWPWCKPHFKKSEKSDGASWCSVFSVPRNLFGGQGEHGCSFVCLDFCFCFGFLLYEEISCLPLAGAKGLHLPFPSTPCWAAVLVFELFKFGGSSSEPVTDHALSYQALQVTGQHALTVLKADAQGSWDPSTKPVLLPPTLPHFPPCSPISQRELIFLSSRTLPPAPLFLVTVPQAEAAQLLYAAAWRGAGLPWHLQLGPLCLCSMRERRWEGSILSASRPRP